MVCSRCVILLTSGHGGQCNISLGGYGRTVEILFLIGSALRFSESATEFSDGFFETCVVAI